MNFRRPIQWFAPLLAMLAFGLAAPVCAQQSDTIAGTAQVAIVQPVQITNTADLAFGNIISNGTGVGRVTINARNGARTRNANVVLTGPLPFGRALFTVTGQPNTVVVLTTNAPSFTLTGPGPAMLVDALRVSRNNAAVRTLPRNYTLPASGSMSIGFGGRLRVANNQTPGQYSGTFDLIVTYQ